VGEENCFPHSRFFSGPANNSSSVKSYPLAFVRSHSGTCPPHKYLQRTGWADRLLFRRQGRRPLRTRAAGDRWLAAVQRMEVARKSFISNAERVFFFVARFFPLAGKQPISSDLNLNGIFLGHLAMALSVECLFGKSNPIGIFPDPNML